MQQELTSLSQVIAQYLRRHLDTSDPAWWRRDVESKLSEQQRRVAQERRQNALDQLDLAALLQVLDRHSRDFRERGLLKYDDLSVLKEARAVRNRWAHVPPSGYSVEDEYRDVDTVIRLMVVLGADTGLLASATESRRMLMEQAVGGSRSQTVQGAPPVAGDHAVGEKVRLRARPDVVGVVMDVGSLAGVVNYRVFTNEGREAEFFADQLESATAATTRQSVTKSELCALLAADQLIHPTTRFLYSLRAGRIDFVPYQYRPVLQLIQADRPRLLIADEVGVGKTIEAGLAIKELRARREVQSILIICPKPLVTERKWQREMGRFDEEFEHLDGPRLRQCIESTDLDGEWPQRYSRAIVPYSLLDQNLLLGLTEGRRNRKGLVQLDPPPAFDLVIVDEAHYIRNTETWWHRNVRYFVDNAEAVLFLSATPVQMQSRDLFNLLQMLRPDQIPTFRDFERMAEPNPAINRAIAVVRRGQDNWQDEALDYLEAALATDWGSRVLADAPIAHRAQELLEGPANDEARVHATRELERLYTFSSLINRTRRRDIGAFTQRKPETVQTDFTPDQRALHDGVLDLERRILQAAHGSVNTAFMMSTIRRQVASCVFGMGGLLTDMLERRFSETDASEADAQTQWNPTEVEAFSGEIQALAVLAASLDPEDPKFDALLALVLEKQGMDNNKVLLFSTFRHTLSYLESKFASAGLRVGLVHGDVAEEERRSLRQRFSLDRDDDDALDLLLSSEVGTEGLDYQFCDMLVNYDLPWNPMRIEQRIGRIDRYGQPSETVAIVNMITTGTIDADIYERCLKRIGIFERSVGASEEILGTISEGIRSIADNLSLTPVERQRQLQQLADNEIRIMAELAELEDKQAELFGLSIDHQTSNAVDDAQSPWLTRAMLHNLLLRYLGSLGYAPVRPWIVERRHLLRASQDVRNALLRDFESLPDKSPDDQAWRRWLKSSKPSLTITLNPEEATENREAVLLSPTHPLVRQAAAATATAGPVEVSLTAAADGLPAGRHPFLVVGWNRLSLRDDFEIRFVGLDSGVEIDFVSALDEASDASDSVAGVTEGEAEELEAAHHRAWSSARAEHVEELQVLVDARLRSLTATHVARVSLLEDQRDEVSDRNIRRMRESQIEAANADFDRRRVALEQARQGGDITATVLARGVLVVVQ